MAKAAKSDRAELLNVFFVVTVYGSVYKVTADPTEITKVFHRSGSPSGVAVGKVYNGHNHIGISIASVCLFTGNSTQCLEDIPKDKLGGHTGIVVGLFINEQVATTAAQMNDLEAADLRYAAYTEVVLNNCQNHPVFRVSARRNLSIRQELNRKATPSH